MALGFPNAVRSMAQAPGCRQALVAPLQRSPLLVPSRDASPCRGVDSGFASVCLWIPLGGPRRARPRGVGPRPRATRRESGRAPQPQPPRPVFGSSTPENPGFGTSCTSNFYRRGSSRSCGTRSWICPRRTSRTASPHPPCQDSSQHNRLPLVEELLVAPARRASRSFVQWGAPHPLCQPQAARDSSRGCPRARSAPCLSGS